MATRWKVNLTPAGRAARVAIGGLGALIGIFLLASASGVLAVVLELLLVLAGPDLVVTGALGYCPLKRCNPPMVRCRINRQDRVHRRGGRVESIADLDRTKSLRPSQVDDLSDYRGRSPVWLAVRS